jgi:hypothetical protein
MESNLLNLETKLENSQPLTIDEVYLLNRDYLLLFEYCCLKNNFSVPKILIKIFGDNIIYKGCMLEHKMRNIMNKHSCKCSYSSIEIPSSDKYYSDYESINNYSFDDDNNSYDDDSHDSLPNYDKEFLSNHAYYHSGYLYDKYNHRPIYCCENYRDTIYKNFINRIGDTTRLYWNSFAYQDYNIRSEIAKFMLTLYVKVDINAIKWLYNFSKQNNDCFFRGYILEVPTCFDYEYLGADDDYEYFTKYMIRILIEMYHKNDYDNVEWLLDNFILYIPNIHQITSIDFTFTNYFIKFLKNKNVNKQFEYFNLLTKNTQSININEKYKICILDIFYHLHIDLKNIQDLEIPNDLEKIVQRTRIDNRYNLVKYRSKQRSLK